MPLIFCRDAPESEALAGLAVETLGRLLPGAPLSVIRHPSGNPWVVGDLTDCRVVESPDRRALLLLEGPGRLPDPRARALAEEISRSRSIPRLLAGCGGDGVLALTLDGSQVYTGAVSGSARIYSAASRGVVLGDSALLLAALCGFEVSVENLAMRLCASLPAHPFSDVPLWPEISSLPCDHFAEVTPEGALRTNRWWHPPAGGISAEKGAVGLADALASVLDSSTQGVSSLSADLSGGLDSTSIVYALASLGVEPRTVHARSVNDRNTDVVWARRAACDLGVELLELPALGNVAQAFLLDEPAAETLPPGPPPLPPDAPALWWGSRGLLVSLLHAIGPGARGVHFTGLGGDELFGPLPAMAWSILREQGPRGVVTLRRLAASAREPLAHVLGSAVGRQGFGAALKAVPLRFEARSDGAGAGREGAPAVGEWFSAPDPGELLSAAGREAATSGVSAVCMRPPEPLDRDRGRHQMMESLHFQGEVLGQVNRAFGGSIRWHGPYLRRAVIEAVSPVRLGERLRPGVAKPLLAAATAQWSMPRDFFLRPVGGEYSADSYAEYAARRHALRAEVGESMLASSGLVDVDAVRGRLDEPVPSPELLTSLETFAAVERWLRGATRCGVGLRTVGGTA